MDKRIKLASQIREFYNDDDEFSGLILENGIPTRKDLKDTETAYVPINILEPKSDVCQAFRNVVKELEEREVL